MRWLAMLLGVLLLATPVAAQRRAQDREYAFVVFLESVAVQGLARTCERGIATYRARFNHVFPLWREKYREHIVVGEEIYREEKEKPNIRPEYRAKLAQVDNVMAQLAQPPGDTSPLIIDNQMREHCERVLEDLNEGLK